MSERVPTGVPQPQGPGEDPLLWYTRLFVRFLQEIFASFEKGAFHWDLDDQLSDIVISDQSPYGRETVEKRPAIVVIRGPAAATNIALDQFYGFDPTTGRMSHSDLISCNMQYNCMSREGLEAQRIAWIAMMATRRFKRTLMHKGLHRVAEEITIGSEMMVNNGSEASPELTTVPVTVPFYFQDSWDIEPVDKVLLNNIDLALTSRTNYPAPGASPIKEPGINGKVLTYDKVLTLSSQVDVGIKKPKKLRE